jgi:hypothetical protein
MEIPEKAEKEPGSAKKLQMKHERMERSGSVSRGPGVVRAGTGAHRDRLSDD